MALFNYAPLDVELGVQRQDADALYLKQLSVYATVRSSDLKESHCSLSDLISGWRSLQGPTEEVTEEVAPVDLYECKAHELKVKGFELDSRIAPGFNYYVRYLGTDELLFNGEARRLESIGLGYGRRMTFNGDTLNFNENYFWTDSNPDGYAFSIEAVREGDEFTIIDSNHQPIGTAVVETAEVPQVELDTTICRKSGKVIKDVKVRFSCFIKHNNVNTCAGGLINVNAQDFEMVEGVAQVVKERGSRKAVVRSVKDVYFQSFGKCSLHNDS